ncbi:18536_t:CDS:1, partial [Gigaspora margarita]
METNAAFVIPKHEDDEFEIHSGSQSHSSNQEKVAEVLGIENNKVVSRVKRMGGSFWWKRNK